MLLTSQSRFMPPLNVGHQQRNVAALLLFLLCFGLFDKFTSALEEGDPCLVKSTPGVCTPGSKCNGFDNKMKQLGLTPDDVVRCGIGIHEEIVCCPGETTRTSVIASTLITTTTTTTTDQPPLIINGNELDKDSDYYDLTKLLNGQNRQNGQNDNGFPTGTGTVMQPLEQRHTFQMTPSTWPSNWQSNAQNGNPNNNFQNINNDPNINFHNMNNNPVRTNQPNPNNNFRNMNRNPMNTRQPNLQFVNSNNNFQNINNNPRADLWRNRPNSNNNFQTRNNNPMKMDYYLQEQPNSIQWPTQNENNGNNGNQLISGDPITTVNNNLRNEGWNIIKATSDEINRPHRPQQQLNSFNFPSTTMTITTPSTILEDPFRRFQFRPQPLNNDIKPINSNNIFVDQSVTSEPPTSFNLTKRVGDRPAKRACAEIEKKLAPALTPHIIGGTPVAYGEYPHMVAIGFSTIGNEGAGGPYSFRCGGSLIDRRFVLTAAHCVNHHELTPEIVRMGVVNFTDPSQMRSVVEVKILESHIHPKYRSSSTYNDIAVLELEKDVDYSEGVYPICLYTEPEDPPANIPLFVSGWGTIDINTRETSLVLLKARQHIVAPQLCNESYVMQGLNRRISEGVVSSQLCTIDPKQKADACQGDSGGPLILVLDEALSKYSLVGVISVGFSCASPTPGLYTRVEAFLDYIESIVWPTGR